MIEYKQKSVIEAFDERMDFIFSEFDNIYVSFSGGKDSGVLLNLTLRYMENKGIYKKLGVFHLDYEAQYQATTDYVDQTYEDLKEKIDNLRCCIPFKVTTCTSMNQSFWRPWDPDMQDLWVREIPQKSFKKEDFSFFSEQMWDYDFQEQFSHWYHKEKNAKKTCVLVGIRTQESLNRFRAIVSDRNIHKYKNKPWTTLIDENIANAYPIYDWVTEDIWTANARYGFNYNKLYDLLYMAGVPLHEQRVASPFLSTAQNSLKLYRAIDPNIWGKLVSRVNGVNFTGIYGGTTAMGWRNIKKPTHFTWKEYMNFLLSTLPEDTAKNYREKLLTSIKFWKEKGGVLAENVIDDLKKSGINFKVGKKTKYKTEKLPVKMEYLDDINSNHFSLIPSYKRMCVCIMKNDHLCKYMGFAQTLEQTIRQKNILEKYRSL